jgi:5'-3' exonuclease
VVLDAGTSKRTELYPEYKATREKMPDDLKWSSAEDPGGDRGVPSR